MTQTVASIQDKSPEELNVICAELCGVDPESHWWCPVCQREVSPTFVKFNETHDGCGGAVELRDSPPYATSYDAIMPDVKKLSDYDHCTLRQWINALTWKDGMNRQEHERAQTEASPADLTRALILTLWAEQKQTP